jgi:methanogenic corrinoid protein MtbC1
VVATLQEAVRAIRLSPSQEADPAAMAGELRQAMREGDGPAMEKLLVDAEQRLNADTLAVELLQPALEGLAVDARESRLSPEQELLARQILHNRLALLAEPAPQGRGFRALTATAPDEQDEAGLLVLALLLRRAGWSVVNLGQREVDDGLDEVISSVQPHAVLFSAGIRENADQLLRLAASLRNQQPELLLLFTGRGFRPAAVAKLGDSAVLVSSDAREAVVTIESLMPAEGPTVNQAA